MHRRLFLQGLGAVVSMTCLSPVSVALGKEDRSGSPALPVLMFHKVDDSPRYPEDISSNQLASLLDFLWRQGFYPVNMSDILTSRVDSVVPRGLKPLGITADDSHCSVVFSQKATSGAKQPNARSLVDIFRDSVRHYGLEPRATLFLSAVGDDRYSRNAEGYFGNSLPLREILDKLDATPGIETGYHTVRHERMTDMSATQVRAVMDEQIRDFFSRGVASRVQRILAYPYGFHPSDEGIATLKDMGFLGAVLAFPGVEEARYTTVPACQYNGTLKTDPFLVPRVCIGAYTYTPKGASSPYQRIDPIEDFRKDVEHALPSLYTSTGQ